MEILTLIILYYLSQKPDFAEKVKPIMGNLKNSEEALKFLNELSHFSEMFASQKKAEEEKTHPSSSQNGTSSDAQKPHAQSEGQKENPQSPTSGIADAFIQDCLDRYFKSH